MTSSVTAPNDNSTSPIDEQLEQPLRGELLSIEHLRVHAVELAKSLVIVEKSTSDPRFHLRFRRNSECLKTAYQTISRSILEGEPPTPEAEWLLDNFYVVEQHLRQIHEDLPRGFFNELPKLADGSPRVYRIALDLIRHTDSVVQQDDLTAFVEEFQSVAPLSIGETWALPTMLRLALVENLRRLAEQMLVNLRTRTELTSILRKWNEGDLVPEVLHTESPQPDLVAIAFTILGDVFPDDPMRFAALEQALMDFFPDSTELIRAEHRRQASNQVTIGNVITSMRLVSALDWITFFEQTNVTERILHLDPSGIYAQMDPATRDQYRHAIEEIAKQSARADIEIAELALKRANDAKHGAATASIQSHIGFWLIDDGRRIIERETGFRPKLKQLLPRFLLAYPNAAYFGTFAILLTATIISCAMFAMATNVSAMSTLILLVAAILPLSEFAVSIVNWLVTLTVPPRLLPKLEFKDGIPEEFRTFVVVPAMLTGRKEIAALLDRLEMHYVSNSDPALRFALLTDFADAPTEHAETDQALIDQAVEGIRRLNTRYAQVGRHAFYLFHRRRKWNEKEGCWMGWERKRGKLLEFNQLLLGNRSTDYLVQEGDLSASDRSSLSTAHPFIITLDADTQLPLGAARRLIGTLAHPLNRPQLNSDGTQVLRGYTILQPRVAVQLQEGNKSWFTRLFANGKGIDPYASAASDVYQDLFAEGSFTGKGIYDVQAFETLLNTAFGENQILSHDLIEGCHVRVGLVSDIEVIDGYPARYDAEAKRSHRWVRGDWQLLPWLMPYVPYVGGNRLNRLSFLSRWKIVDNLRRSLVPPSIILFLVLSWILAPSHAAVWSLVAWLSLGVPVISCIAVGFLSLPRPEYWKAHAITTGNDLLRSILQLAIQVACLPYKSYLMVDAIVRTLVRLTATRTKMLEWETAASTERRLARNQWSILVAMLPESVFALVIAVLLPRDALLAAVPWLFGWLVSPLIAHWISQPIRPRVPTLSIEDQNWLRLQAKLAWSYFEVHVNEASNWLPPDNLQEHPDEKVAERISPTNEGLFLVSLIVARDFGFVGLYACIDLCEKNLASWKRLPQLNGHNYNWYDTASLQPLMPRYVSTVDSGNLLASLIVLQKGIIDTCRSPVFGNAIWQGLRDTLSIAIQSCDQLQPRGAVIVSPPLDNLKALLVRYLEHLSLTPQSWIERNTAVGAIGRLGSELPQLLQIVVDSHRHPILDLKTKVDRLIQMIGELYFDVERIVPWVDALSAVHRRIAVTPATGNQLRLAWVAVQQTLEKTQSVEEFILLPENVRDQLAALEFAIQKDDVYQSISSEMCDELEKMRSGIQTGANTAVEIKARCQALSISSENMALGIKFDFLYDPERRLFAIGFNLEDGKLDRSHYDMLCSEARLTSQLAIAKGDVEFKHWFQLGRQMTMTAGQKGLLSWGGTMFEFLMPVLFQGRCAESLLSQACEAAVARQREYGKQCRVPWGVSESAFAAHAVNADYFYRSFGVPGLGLKRGLSDDRVVAPYATMLALAISPAAAVENLRRLASEGGLGRFGFYDAVDYSPARLPPGRKALPVRCYMAHHQGMSIAAIANVLLQQIVETRFHAHPIVRATALLLEESVPSLVPVLMPHADETSEVRVNSSDDTMVSRRIVGYETPTPRTQLLSNGTYSLMVTNTGGGYSQFQDIAINRWLPDGIKDCGGQYIYIRNRKTGEIWSATYQPTCKRPDYYEVLYSIDKAEFRRRDGDIETLLEITVSPDHNVEHRQLKISNRSKQPCELDITSYVEVSMTTAAADIAHPAFQKLFVETEFLVEESTLLAKRRPRESTEQPVWAFHVLARTDLKDQEVQFESSRQNFLGRGRNLSSPALMDAGARLSGTTGNVLDPIFSLRCNVFVEGYGSSSLAFSTGTASTREDALRLADQFHEQRSVVRAFELSWVFNQVQLHHLHLSAAKAHRFQQLASLLLFPQKVARGPESSILANRQSQSALWRFGISGDRLMLLVNVGEIEHVEFVRELLLAHQYWEHHGLSVDLVILNTHPGSYLDELQDMLQQLIQDAPHQPIENKASIFLLRASQIPREDLCLLESAAQVVMEARRGWLTVLPQSIKGQASQQTPRNSPLQRAKEIPDGRTSAYRIENNPIKRVADAFRNNGDRGYLAPNREKREELEFWNGRGGFASDGREYHIRLTSALPTPAPWSNIIANPRFGCLVTETGGGYTWAENSRQNKLTSWSNDPVLDSPSEVLFLRNDKTQDIWQPMSLPEGAAENWVHHGQGFTRFVRTDRELDQEVFITIAPSDPVKFIILKLRNRASAERHLSATYYADFVLGVTRTATQMHVVTELDTESGAVLVRNSYHPTNSQQVAYLQVLGQNRSHTADRNEFVGRNRDLRSPLGMQHSVLSGTTGAGLDPCAAIQTRFSLGSGETLEIVFQLGCGADLTETRALLDRYKTLMSVQAAAKKTVALWDEILTEIQVESPNRAFDILVNRWLLYQVLSCRLWGRSAFYQSGGAFGFRDQLQDAMALVYSRPDLSKEQLLKAAARQFEEGDVQHWWHPPLGEGTRTRFSDDLLWLPYVTAHYIRITSDHAVLDEITPFLHSSQLAPHEQERYELPQSSPQHGSLYEHCLRALDRGFRLGDHGLPLMGCGDWNDGMNHVGALGRGESVWVGWFLLTIIDDFVPLMETQGDNTLANEYRERARQLRQALEQHAWDGKWYRRAYYDDGTPLGSAKTDECQIDSIAQSWAVLADADPRRTDQALASVFERLVEHDNRLVTLFTPPFDKTLLDPGYIKGYPPGVRENGGQYTHAVFWLIQALTMKGDGDRAMKIFDYVNPILHSRNAAEVDRYRVEPYVIAADVYSVSPHEGRGGWTWYTGSAGWAYRIAIEAILGITIRGNQVRFTPCVPLDWETIKVSIRCGSSKWTFSVHPFKHGQQEIDDVMTGNDGSYTSESVEILDDGQEHFQHIHCEASSEVCEGSRGNANSPTQC